MRRTVSLLVPLALAVAAVSAPTSPAGAESTDPPTCQGRAATLVGSDDTALEGTPGDDVIVTAGSASVSAMGGDDLVCVTGPRLQSVAVDGGDGDDVLVVLARRAETLLDPGAGSDVVLGGNGRDNVQVLRSPTGASDVDRIETGAGPDYVQYDGSRFYGPGVFPATDVRLGSSRDQVLLEPLLATIPDRTTIRGGAGDHDRLGLSALSTSRVRLDLRTGGLEVDGVAVAGERSGFEQHEVQFGPRAGSARAEVIGTGGPDRVTVGGARSVDIALGGGGDRLEIDNAGVHRGRIDAGTGTDHLVAAARTFGESRPLVDLARGVITRVGAKPTTPATRVAGFEGASLDDQDGGVLVGDRGPNLLQAVCGTVRGGGGADTIDGIWISISGRGPVDRTCYNPYHQFRGNGGRGADELIGTSTGDVLIGGPGRDRATGLRGRDRCVAEVTATCER
ncbi:hypothetical protein FE634_12830 [Nocardioides dongxiaopingii]|uniref:hypothetical protein n=1 Tax=Nocardioides sp. S-1144 TaxID=2582905 RepID=UPI00116589CF|nr:hypothetical protein [Nocardioides sp. S-1144]QCW51069.2 hypothetical protein FE634_12830 [Nocardioides sp. S-1144]